MTVVSPSSFPAAPELAQRSTAPGVAARETATTTGASEMHAATVRWLVRLRWLAVVGQALAVLLVAQSVSSTGTAVLMGVTLLSAGSNAALHRFAARLALEIQSRRWTVIGGVLTLDCLLLSVWLAYTGATANPFTVLYLVHIVLAAVVLNARWTAWVSTLAVGCFAALFLVPRQACCGLGNAGVESAYLTHMQGMWFAFAAAALLISYFVRQLTLAAERQREQIVLLQAQAQHAAHMASLTTLAAGTAHELRTPLSTIAVAAHELKLGAGRLGANALAEDAELIEAEIERCQTILYGMGSRLREGSSRPVALPVAEVLQVLKREYADATLVEWEAVPPDLTVSAVEADFVVSLRGLINNAIDATRAKGSVTVAARRDGYQVVLYVEDSGCGMEATVLERAAEPFFTTKAPGQGVGLGLFVAFAFAQNNGGELRLRSVLERGTVVELRLPLAETA